MTRGLFDPPPRSKDQSPGAVTLEGVLERITFFNEENGWSVIKLEIPGRQEPVTVVGSLPGVQPGESLRLTGRWIQDRKWGEQFKAESCLTIAPATLIGMEKYLGSGLVRGMGKVMAGRLVKHFQFDTLEVIDHDPDRLTEVEGIGPKRKALIVAAWSEQRAVKEVMLFLQSHGISTTYAVKIYKQYGDHAIALVSENPYRLALDIYGIGFLTADRIAKSLGVAETSPQRAAAGILHVLGQLADEGHVFCPADQLVAQAAQILSIEASIIEEAIAQLTREELLVQEGESFGQLIYLAALHAAESGAAQRLRLILETPRSPITVDMTRALAWLEEQQGIRLAQQQQEATRQAIAGKLLVITGGPGTGKTTMINGVIRILEKKGRRILLCAPTGRAAKRLAEATSREARTIHRTLEYNPRQRCFERNAERPLAADVLIVDEMSMVDIVLFHHLLRAVPPTCQLLFVGDVDQLPSVGPGSVLQDLIQSRAVPVVILTEIFRQAQESHIVVNAHRVNRGELPLGPAEESSAQASARTRPIADFYLIERDDPEAILSTIKELVSRRIPQRFHCHPLDDIQVLTPMHKGLLGSINLNAQLQTLLNPAGDAVQRGSRLFRVGDKVMQLRNNYDLEVFNGDLGRVLSIDPVDRLVAMRFDERVVSFDFADLDELTLGYACSIHKSQGSEYPAVIIPLHTQHYTMLQRNLLYTGITRGKRLVVLIGSRKALALAVKNSHVEERHTRLAHRLLERRKG